MIENDTWYRCNICGREGRVGRCCSDEDRTPLNDLARAEQERIKGGVTMDGLFDKKDCEQVFNDIINRLTEIQDCIRYNKTFDACVKIDSLQRMLADVKLTSDNSDCAKCEHDFEPRKTWVHTCKKCGIVQIEKGHFA